MSDWIDTLVALRESRTPAIVVTVASTKGSVPREAGTKMIVTATDVYGTIGGGHLEHKAIAIARDQLSARTASEEPLRRFPLGASLGQCCGGLANLLFEALDGDAPWLDAVATARRDGRDCIVVTAVNGNGSLGKAVVTSDAVFGPLCDAAIDFARTLLARDGATRLATIDGATLLFDLSRATDFHVVVFGAGHVGRALVRILGELPCRVAWVDERDTEFPRDIAGNVRVACTDAPEEEVDAAPAGAYFLVMTHSHALDEALAERILRRGDYAYFGLIGSMTKRRAFEKRMERRGMPVERFATMTCPIGLSAIAGKEPAVIAVAVAAELLQVRASAAAANGIASARRA
jgi:xanthine dehydrogenase accessory factor